MKHIRQSLALLLALLLMLALAACSGQEEPTGSVSSSGDESQDVSGTVSDASDEEEPEGQAEEADQEVETDQEEPADEEEPNQEEPADEEEPNQEEEASAGEEELELGTMVGGVYENAYFGIGCKLDDNWVYASEEELAEMVGASAEVVNDEELQQQILEADIFYDMYAAADDGAVNMSVNVENLGVLYGTILDEDGYIDMATESLEESMASAGMTVTSLEKTTVTFAGQERTALCLHSVYDEYELDIYQLLVCIKEGGYMATVTMTSMGSDITDTMAAMFYAVE